jgi:2'-5' RNA ligase
MIAGDKQAQSAILVPVPEADVLVGNWRIVHDPKARTGVPAHITLVVPWIPPEQLKPEHLEELDDLLADQGPFDYELDRVCWFGERVLWLAPTPDEPFKSLTTLLAGHFSTPPWQGEFAEVVPHLTVGLAGYAIGHTLADAADDLSTKLPLHCRAREIDVMCGDGGRWEVLHRVTLGSAPGGIPS